MWMSSTGSFERGRKLLRAIRLSGAILALSLAGLSMAGAQTPAETAFVKKIFEPLQHRSFAKKREYCGFIGYDKGGKLTATEPVEGTSNGCGLTLPYDVAVIASYHTHGAFDIPYYNEIPSDIDMLSDQSMRINGWIATPGGRLWFVDSRAMVARQICGLGCLPVAPGFYKSQAGDVAESYSFEALITRLSR